MLQLPRVTNPLEIVCALVVFVLLNATYGQLRYFAWKSRGKGS